jgi:hypothetical protein
MRLEGFIGPSNTTLSYKYDFERTINFYTEVSGAGVPKSKLAMIGTPGLRLRWELAQSPVRQLFYQDGRLFAVAGGGFYELFANYTSTLYGAVARGFEPVTICSNGSDGHQLFIVSGGLGYIFDLNANTLTQITDPDFPTNAKMGAFLDGYFLCLQADTDKFFTSALEDGLSWNGLDVGQSNQSSDITQAMLVDHREIWLFGSQTTGVWYNNGDPSFPFVPISGVFIQQGIIAPFSAQSLDNSVFWLGGNEQGYGVAYRAAQFTPQRISTHATEFAWMQYERLDDAIAYTYQEDGHAFYVIWFPSGETSWVYDVTTSQAVGAPQWHERAHWNPQLDTWQPHVSRCHAFAFNKHFVGDRRSGAIYEQSVLFYDEELVVPE